MTTMVDVLDTAVKIGLGAMISGVVTFWHTRQKERGESLSRLNSKRQELLEKAASQVEQVNHVYLKYWALVVEATRYDLSGTEWPQKRVQELDETKDELFQSFKYFTDAESKILLINEPEIYDLMRGYGELVVKFRRGIYVGKPGLDECQISLEKSEIKVAREKLFRSLSKAYINGLQ